MSIPAGTAVSGRSRAVSERRSGMVRIDEGSFLMGSDRHYPEERPARRAGIDAFWADTNLVTNAEFASFVAATGYSTVAERPLDLARYPGAKPELAVPGGLVFRMTSGPVDTRDIRHWWHYVPGACWRQPDGPGSDLAGRDAHPVVQVAFEDAESYAAWAGKRLPTEAEWECAARGGLEGAEFCWGDEFTPGGRHLANTWQGPFPWRNFETDGFAGTSPVGAFPPNGFGLFDTAGNVWEWTVDWYGHGPEAAAVAHTCCVPHDPQGATETANPGRHSQIPRKVIKGGSFLCAPSYCRRYRPAARHAQPIDTGTCHIGFRCVTSA